MARFRSFGWGLFMLILGAVFIALPIIGVFAPDALFGAATPITAPLVAETLGAAGALAVLFGIKII